MAAIFTFLPLSIECLANRGDHVGSLFGTQGGRGDILGESNELIFVPFIGSDDAPAPQPPFKTLTQKAFTDSPHSSPSNRHASVVACGLGVPGQDSIQGTICG